MDSFISKVVKDVINKNTTIKDCVFVLPSQRACVFLKKELVESTTSSFILPKIISIENYIQELADINLIDTTQLLFEFYSVYKEILTQELIESFETFSQWATIVLHDFNEIDSYLVSSKDLFSNLKDLKKIEYWFQDKAPSKLALNYLQFFEHLNKLYNSLYKKLKKNKFGYQGLIYREAVHNLEYYIENNNNKHIVFIGFNALNKAEEVIFQELLNNNLASIYWDSNPNLFNNANEAGVFLRKYKTTWAYYKKAPFLWMDETNLEERNIEFIGAPKNITQIKYAGELLSKFENHQNTALVLADENLLALTLNSLPNSVKNINITMGYPLKDIPFSNLFEKLFKLHLNQQKFNKKTQHQFYYKDVLNLLNDPFLNKLHGETLQKIVAKLKSENTIFLSKKAIEDCISNPEKEQLENVLILFTFSNNVNTIIKQCSNLINVLKNYVDGVDKEYLYRFYTVFKQLETLNGSYNHITNLKTLAQFYNQLLNNEKLAFQGEPLKGLQLMGMLETRALDFETVIITSVNEGILPGSKNENSFLPFDVKKYFKMPTYQEKDAIFSYHFQRLLQRAKNVYLIYNTETDGYGSGEKSRFLTQLEINNPSIKKTIINPKVQKHEEILLQIEKTPDVINKLKAVFTKGISPSALATYIYNPISFYEQKVLEIRDDDEVEETIAANTMGSVIHDVLEQLYKPFIGVFLSKENIVQMQQQTPELLIKFFEKHYKKGNIETGKNKLIFEVCKNHINRFLKQELSLIHKGNKLKILALEAKLNCNIIIEGIGFSINLRGIVDRIDELNGSTRIIDYKTGKVEAKHLKMDDFSVIGEEYKYTKAMQVMLYSFMFVSNENANFNKLESGIISFKNLNAGFLKMNFSEKPRGVDSHVSEERIHDFMIEIKNIIKEILNPEIPFIQKEDLPF